MDSRRSKYTNYRYSNYMQEGLAILKIGSSVESTKFTNSRTIGRNNNILYLAKRESVPKNSAAKLNKSHDSTTWKHNKSFEDKGIRTTKNFIGKPCYNVGQNRNFFSFFLENREIPRIHFMHKLMFTVRGERIRLQTTRGSPRLQHPETRVPGDGKTLRRS